MSLPRPSADPRPLRIAYLVNTYPVTSASFVRRELQAVEALGSRVDRLALRRWAEALVDPDDQAELRKTRAVLDEGAARLALATARVAASRPSRFARALKLAITLGRRGSGHGQGVFRHLIYLAEACVLLGWHEEAGTHHVHAHFGTNSTAVACLCRALGGPPYSFTAHGPEEFDRPLGLGLDLKARDAAFVAAISHHGKSQIRRWLPYDQWQKVNVVHCGLDSSFLDAPPVPIPDAPELACVARLAEQKGLPTLIEAAGLLRSRGVDFRLTIIGDGPLRGEIESLIDRLDLGGSVRLAGWQGNAEVRALFERSRALVLPSYAEGLPVVIMEALALGRPVVSTWVAGIPELVRPGRSGWLVPPGDAQALADAMDEVLRTSPETLEAMGRRGALDVQERHNARTEAATLLGLIRASLGRDKAPPALATATAGSAP
ncbi:MAG: glycosyltransferase [Isosphaeraceae bacterium]